MHDLSKCTVEELWMLYNAIMAGAYPGNEHAIEDELTRRGAM